MPDTTTATLARHAADRLHQTHGTVGRPKFLGFFQRKDGMMLAQWDDGSYAAEISGRWVPMPPLDYDALFCVTGARADD